MKVQKINKILLVYCMILTVISISYIVFSILTKIERFGFFVVCISLVVSLVCIYKLISENGEKKVVEKQTQRNIKDVYLYYQLLEPPDMNN